MKKKKKKVKEVKEEEEDNNRSTNYIHATTYFSFLYNPPIHQIIACVWTMRRRQVCEKIYIRERASLLLTISVRVKRESAFPQTATSESESKKHQGPSSSEQLDLWRDE